MLSRMREQAGLGRLEENVCDLAYRFSSLL